MTQSTAPVYNGALPASGIGIVCSRTCGSYNKELSEYRKFIVLRFQDFLFFYASICRIHTFTVSKGWPEATRHIPPNPPAKKSLVGEVFFSGILNHVSKFPLKML